MMDFLDWDGDIPYNTEYKDSYYSSDGGYAESRHVYLSGVELPEVIALGKNFRLAELGFGTGLNFLMTALAWDQNTSGKLHYCAIEKFPLSLAMMEKAWQAFPELSPIVSLAKQRLGVWVEGFQRIWFTPNIVLDLYVGDVTEMLPIWMHEVDGWYLDGFAPKHNPEMFSDNVLDHVDRLSSDKVRVASFTVAGSVRRGLLARGFSVEKVAGFGRKATCLKAIKMRNKKIEISKKKKIAIIGAGIAGSSLAHQLCFFSNFGQNRAELTVIAPNEQQAEASRVPFAAVSPRFSAKKTPRGILIAQTFRYACQYYDTFAPDAWQFSRGAMKLPSPFLDVSRLQVAADLWSEWGVKMLNSEEVSAKFRGGVNTLVQQIEGGGVIDTNILLQNLQKNFFKWNCSVTNISYHQDCWQVSNGVEAREFDIVIVATGAGTHTLLPELQDSSRIKYSRMGFYPTDTPFKHTFGGWGGHAVPAEGGFWYGIEPECDALPQALLQMGYRKQKITQYWGANKLSVDHHLPYCQALNKKNSLFVLAGAGGHGFSLMPWFASKLATEIL